MKTGKTQKPLFFAIVFLLATVSALKLSDVVQLRKKLQKMESENGLLPEGRKLAEVAQGSLKDFDQVSVSNLQAHKKATKGKKKAAKVRKAQKKVVTKKAAKKRVNNVSQRKLNSIDGQSNLAAQSASPAAPQQSQDNGLAPAKYEKVSQKIQDQNKANFKNVKNQNSSQDRALKAFKSHHKRRHRVAAASVRRRHRRAASKSAHRRHRNRVAASHKKSVHRRNKSHAKKVSKKAKKNVKAKKASKKKHRNAAGKVKKAVSKKTLKNKPQAKKLRDLPANNKENEKLALDAINANAATPQQKEAPKMTERKLLDLPSQNEFYEQIVSNYYPTI